MTVGARSGSKIKVDLSEIFDRLTFANATKDDETS